MTIGEHSKEYLDYLKSEAWKKKRLEKLSISAECENSNDVRYRVMENGDVIPVKMCNGRIEVHHKSYSNLGNEELSDLSVLCNFHHNEVHEHWKSHSDYAKFKKLKYRRDYA